MAAVLGGAELRGRRPEPDGLYAAEQASSLAGADARLQERRWERSRVEGEVGGRGAVKG